MLGTKPRTQRTGDKLEDLNLSVRLHASFCNPEEELDALENSRRVGYILGLVSGDGRYYGDYLIRRLSYTLEKQGPDGGMWSVTVSLTLKEYWYDDRAAAARRQARAVGFAVPGNSRPFVTPPVTTFSKNAALAMQVAKIAAAAAGIAAAVRGATTNENRRGFYLREAGRQAGNLIDAAGVVTSAPSSGADGQSEIINELLSPGASGNITDAAARVRDFAATGDLTNVQVAAGQVATLAGDLNTASQRAAVATATGKTSNTN